MLQTKKILLIVGLLIVAVLIGYGFYRLFQSTNPLQRGPGISSSPTGTLPLAGDRPLITSTPGGATGLPTANFIPSISENNYYQTQPVNRLTDDYVISPSLNNSGSVRYHNAADGKFYRIQSDGSIKALSDQIFYNVKNITWGKTKDIAVLEYPDNSKIVYNFETQKQVTLPKHWEEFSFSSDSEEIAAKSIGLSPENRWLVTVKNDGTGTKTIEPMGNNADKVQIDWSPSRQVVAFSQTGQPLGAERREILMVGLNGENFKSTVVEGVGFEPQWSPTGKKLLYSVYSSRSEYKPELWVVNAYGDEIGSNRQTLKINTWAHKCSFSDDSYLYCAVPKNLPSGAGMAPTLADGVYDDLYRVDLRTGGRTPINLGGDYQIENISFDNTGRKILFTDKFQSGIFEVKL